jgi:uncharacterized protein YabE (DUF348 family)
LKKGKYAKLFALVRYPVMLIGVTVMSIALASGIFASNINTVTICYNGTLIDVTTTGRTVKEALSVAGINLTEDDYINHDIDTSLSGVDFIEIETPITLTVNVEGREVMIKSRQSTVSEVLEQNDIELTARDLVIGAELDEITENGMNLSIVRIQEEYDIENITIEYETEYVPSNYLLKGQTKVLTPGREGVRTLVYRVIKEENVEISRTLVSDKITVNPIKEIIAYGTIANFVNSRGQTVSYTQAYEMTATAYTACEKWGYAVHMPGKRARVGVVAVDPTVIPLGTKLYVEGMYGAWDYGFCVAWDTGGAIKGHKIDLFMDTEEECFRWGIKKVKVYVLHDQSIDVFSLRG